MGNSAEKEDARNTRPDRSVLSAPPLSAPPRWLEGLVSAARGGRFAQSILRDREVGEAPTPGFGGADTARGAARTAGGSHVRGAAHRAGEARRVQNRGAAVLIALSAPSYGEGTALPRDAGVLLTHRASSMRSHAGQVAFPGGKRDPEDRDAVACALREAHEETGLTPAAVRPLAVAGPFRVRASGTPVTAVLGLRAADAPVHAASPAETDDVFVVPLRELVNPEHRVMLGHGRLRFPSFWVNGYLVWGLTGALLDGVIRHAGWEEEWDTTTVRDLEEAVRRSRNNEAPGSGATLSTAFRPYSSERQEKNRP